MVNSSLSQAVLFSGKLSEYITLKTLFYTIVVLAILVIIMLITYFTTIKPNLMNNTSMSQSSQLEHQVITQIAEREEEELLNNYELVAVITAAIYASMGDTVPADGLVVRSIRRVNQRNRMKA